MHQVPIASPETRNDDQDFGSPGQEIAVDEVPKENPPSVLSTAISVENAVEVEPSPGSPAAPSTPTMTEMTPDDPPQATSGQKRVRSIAEDRPRRTTKRVKRLVLHWDDSNEVYASEYNRTDDQEDEILRNAIIEEEGLEGDEAEKFDVDALDEEDTFEIGADATEDKDYEPGHSDEDEGEDDDLASEDEDEEESQGEMDSSDDEEFTECESDVSDDEDDIGGPMDETPEAPAAPDPQC